MRRIMTKWVLAAGLGVASLVATAGPASAQYLPAFGGGFRSGTPFFMGSPYMMSPFNYSFANPYTGGVLSYQYSPYGGYNGYSFFNPYTGRAMSYQAYIPYYMAAGYGGGGYGGYATPSTPFGYGGTAAGGYGTSSNPVTNQQLRQLRAASYQSGYPSGGYGDSRSGMSPRWTTDKNDKSPAKPADVSDPLLKASEKDINSGQALNALAIEIRKLEGKGAKAEEVPLLPADVLTRVAYEGTAKESKDAVTAPKWGPMGATASELVRRMDRDKLQFAPAPAGAEEAYDALYRGLSRYYFALGSAKK